MAATLTPVDHDPFAVPAAFGGAEGTDVPGVVTTARGPRLTPVDHDPFGPAMDFNRPVHEVRADIAKIPEGPQRDAAMKQWADAYVAKERANVKAQDLPGAINPSRMGDTIRNVARGTLVGSFADELNAATAAGLHKLSGGAMGAPYDEAVEYQRALDRALDKEAPLKSGIEQTVGALGSGAPIAKAVLGTGKTVLGKMGRGTLLGPAYGYTAGFGQGEGDLEARHENATSGEGHPFGLSPAMMGLLVGTMAPPVISGVGAAGGKVIDAVSPTLARVAANVREIPKKIGLPAMSADGGMPDKAGATAAAQQIIANQLTRAGRGEEDLRNILKQVEESRRYSSSGKAQDVVAPVDLDPSLARLAGSTMRASPEAGNIGQAFHSARQTGVTPAEGMLPPTAGLPTRPMLAKPVTAEQSVKNVGTDFGAGSGNVVPMGQGERLGDALKRAFQIKDSELHGHGSNALRTDQEILAAAKEEAKALYGQTYNAGQNVDLRPTVTPVFQKWSDRASEEPAPVRAALQRAMRLFANEQGNLVGNIEHFDKSKQFLDGVIEKYFESPIGRNRYLGGVLNDFKKELLGAVNSIKTNGLGDKYAAARGAFGSRMEAREALQAGKDAFKADSDIGVDAYRGLTGDGHQKLFRLGLLSGYEKAAANMKAGADKTQLFDNPRIQALLSEVIPRTETTGGKAKGVFGNRPERFGDYVGTEKRMIDTRNTTLGNSMTQRNIKDDEAFQMMSKAGQAVDTMLKSGSVTAVAVRSVEHMLNKLFGFRNDTAVSIARQLFTADPVQRDRVIRAVAARLGPDRFQQFTQLLDKHQRGITAASSRQNATPEAE